MGMPSGIFYDLSYTFGTKELQSNWAMVFFSIRFVERANYLALKNFLKPRKEKGLSRWMDVVFMF